MYLCDPGHKQGAGDIANFDGGDAVYLVGSLNLAMLAAGKSTWPLSLKMTMVDGDHIARFDDTISIVHRYFCWCQRSLPGQPQS